MPSITYGSSAYKRTDGNFPPLVLINMFIEKAATSEQQVALISRHGLQPYANLGDGPVSALYQRADLFTGDLFAIAGSILYRGLGSIGSITGTGATSFASAVSEIVLTRGQTAYSYNGTDLAAIAFPDGAHITAVTYIGGLFVYARAASGKFYWSAVLDGRTVDALDFATAEREADNLIDLAALGDNLWLFGANSVEAWAHTGASDLPFVRNENVAFDKGIMATGCVTKADNSLFFVGSNRVVYRLSDVPARISDHAIEEQIVASNTAQLFSFQREGHEFVCLRLDTKTLAYDCATGEWCEFQTQGGQWAACSSAMIGATAYFGNDMTGDIMTLGGWDDMGVELERRFTAASPVDLPTIVNRLSLWVNPGETSDLTSDPVVEMRYSDDAGETWSEWETESLGPTGQFRVVPEWRALGMFDFPGMLFEFRVTDACPFRVSAVKVNDPAGGRGR